MNLYDLAVPAGMGLLGCGLWQLLTRWTAAPLTDEDTSRHGLAVFLVGMILQATLLGVALGDVADLEQLDLAEVIGAQAVTSVVAVLAALAVARALGVRIRLLGLREHHGPPVVLTALAGWLIFFPVVVVCSWLNRLLIPVLTDTDGEQLQSYLEQFVNEDGASSDPLVWLSMVLVIPVAEEVLFRGALYGGLRRLMPPAVAMVLAAIVFGSVHDGVAMLPAAAIGVMLAWLYERTGSLFAPCLAHALQNGLTLTLAATVPEAL